MESVVAAVAELGLKPVRTSFRSPWQNGAAERWVGSCRRDVLDHVIPLSEQHLKRLLSEYVRYYHVDRTHLGLGKDTPDSRVRAEQNCRSRILSFPRLGGLHHRYNLAALGPASLVALLEVPEKSSLFDPLLLDTHTLQCRSRTGTSPGFPASNARDHHYKWCVFTFWRGTTTDRTKSLSEATGAHA